MGSYKKSLAMLKSGGGLKAKDIQCPAPLFVADCNEAGFCVCVCKDPDNCPSTVETLSPEEAAKQAAEAHAWNEAGGPNAKGASFIQLEKDEGPLRCPAPLFVAEGQFCVCKDPENCPSTAETLTPEQAAQLAAEAHTWNQSGAPGTR